jgi:hypothetical protein
MAIEEWYLQKAKQCSRLAAEATEPSECARYKREGMIWRELADDLATQDRTADGPP